MNKQSCVCGRCRIVMCEDCLSITDEYAELLQNHQHAAYDGTNEIETLRKDLARAKTTSKMWEDLAKLGYPDVIQKWMDEQNKEKVAPATP